jgi:hypothetical protein
LLDTGPLRSPSSESENDDHARFVVLPLQGPEWACSGPDERSHLIHYARRRLNHFDLTPIFPDFYGQISQFLVEVTLCVRLGIDAYMDDERYGLRLVKWWNDWNDARGAWDFDQLQNDHHDLLNQAFIEVRDILEPPENEVLRAELWLRWDPDNLTEGRRLRLWCSTAASWRSPDTMREGELDPTGEYFSARVFCEGRTLRIETGDSTDRWQTYLGQPIYLSKRGELPVGVVTLTSMRGGGHGVLGDEFSSLHPLALGALAKAGRAIADPEAGWRRGEGV